MVNEPTSIHEDVGLIPSVGLRIWHCHELWCRLWMKLESQLLWLWHKPSATALTRPLAWESPYAVGVAKKEERERERKEGRRKGN